MDFFQRIHQLSAPNLQLCISDLFGIFPMSIKGLQNKIKQQNMKYLNNWRRFEGSYKGALHRHSTGLSIGFVKDNHLSIGCVRDNSISIGFVRDKSISIGCVRDNSISIALSFST
jgi:hypothetical protein